MFRTTLLASGMALALLAAGPAVAQDKPPVKIAAIVPQSGAGAFDGQLALEGMQAEAALARRAWPASEGIAPHYARRLLATAGADAPAPLVRLQARIGLAHA